MIHEHSSNLSFGVSTKVCRCLTTGLCTCVHVTCHTCYYCVHRHCPGFPHVHIAQLCYQVLTMCLQGVWLNNETKSKFCCCDKISTRLTWGNHGLFWLLVGRDEVHHGREDREAGMKGVCWHFIHRREAERNECYCTSGLFILPPVTQSGFPVHVQGMSSHFI